MNKENITVVVNHEEVNPMSCCSILGEIVTIVHVGNTTIIDPREELKKHIKFDKIK